MSIKSRQCGLQTSNAFSGTARRTGELATPNSSGRNLELPGAVDKWLGKLFFLWRWGKSAFIHWCNPQKPNSEASPVNTVFLPMNINTFSRSALLYRLNNNHHSCLSHLHRHGVAGEGPGSRYLLMGVTVAIHWQQHCEKNTIIYLRKNISNQIIS